MLLWEAITAGRTLAEAAASISPGTIARHLYLADSPELDLIIRTSGEVRLSGVSVAATPPSVGCLKYAASGLWKPMHRQPIPPLNQSALVRALVGVPAVPGLN